MKERPIAFYAEIARELQSINAAIFYQQIRYWSDKGYRDDGWIYKSAEEIERETTLTENMQRICRRILVEEKKWLEVKKMKVNGGPTWHYRLLIDFSISMFRTVKTTVRTGENHSSNPLKSQNLYTETTTENTTDETSSSLTSIPGVETGENYQPDYDPAKRKAGKRTPTEKQRDAFNAMRSITYYREKADAAGMDYLKIDDESANKRFQKQAKDFEKRYRANWKEVIDWWFDDGEGDWANFHPSNFFNISTYMKFDNAGKGKKGGAKHYA